MERLLTCRVCLATDVNLYDMYKYKLKNMYECISGLCVSIYWFVYVDFIVYSHFYGLAGRKSRLV